MATCNEAIVLLEIYRGSFNRRKRKGTDERDITALINKGLIEKSMLDCTVRGLEAVANILKVINGKLIAQ